MLTKTKQYFANVPNDLSAVGLALAIMAVLSYLNAPNKGYFLIIALIGILLTIGTLLFLIKKATSPWQLVSNLITGLGLATLFAGTFSPGTNQSGAFFVAGVVLLILAWGIRVQKVQ